MNKERGDSPQDKLGDGIEQPDSDLCQQSRELLMAVMSELCIGRNLGRTPYSIRKWEGRRRRRKRRRAAARLSRRLLGVKAVRTEHWVRVNLPPPDYVDLPGEYGKRLYQQQHTDTHFLDAPQPGEPYYLQYDRVRTPGYTWYVGRRSYGGFEGGYISFDATVNALGRVEFHIRGLVFPADPQGWRAVVAEFNTIGRGIPIRMETAFHRNYQLSWKERLGNFCWRVVFPK